MNIVGRYLLGDNGLFPLVFTKKKQVFDKKKATSVNLVTNTVGNIIVINLHKPTITPNSSLV